MPTLAEQQSFQKRRAGIDPFRLTVQAAWFGPGLFLRISAPEDREAAGLGRRAIPQASTFRESKSSAKHF